MACKYGRRRKNGQCPRKRSTHTAFGPRCAGVKANGRLRKGFRWKKGGGGCPIPAKGS